MVPACNIRTDYRDCRYICAYTIRFLWSFVLLRNFYKLSLIVTLMYHFIPNSEINVICELVRVSVRCFNGCKSLQHLSITLLSFRIFRYIVAEWYHAKHPFTPNLKFCLTKFHQHKNWLNFLCSFLLVSRLVLISGS
jgi:hypothetical protein